MTGRDAAITSIDPQTGERVRVVRTANAWVWEPATAVVLIGRTAGGGTSSCCTCPYVNFHTKAESADADTAAHLGLRGIILDQVSAVRVADAAFGPLLGYPWRAATALADGQLDGARS
jgi:hypothetical protein